MKNLLDIDTNQQIYDYREMNVNLFFGGLFSKNIRIATPVVITANIRYTIERVFIFMMKPFLFLRISTIEKTSS